jgi:NAD(P)-dependent dehydrogenase (short-subunit alcohol dehydrogenase family)
MVSAKREQDAKQKVPKAEHIRVGDLSSIDGIKYVANETNALGQFDAVIHNAGVYQAAPKDIFAVNILAPYLLTCLMHKPRRLIYLSSSVHLQGYANLEDFGMGMSRINYSDSKLYCEDITGVSFPQ